MFISSNFTFMAVYSLIEIDSWERFYRANLINSLTGFKSVCLIGTINREGRSNLAIFSSIVHIGSNPPLVGYISRPLKAVPNTIANIETTGVYTINHIHPAFIERAHQTSAKYPDGISEFDEVGLTQEFVPAIAAPFVKESSVKYALELQEIIPIKLNDTFLVIGKIICIQVEQDIISENGFLNLDKVPAVCGNGLDSYYSASLINRYHYAKPGSNTKKIT